MTKPRWEIFPVLSGYLMGKIIALNGALKKALDLNFQDFLLPKSIGSYHITILPGLIKV
jgi:hypothetical protein